MKILRWLFNIHSHYWGIPHKKDGRLVVCCYECGSEREFLADVEVA